MSDQSKINDFPLHDRNPWDPQGIFERLKKEGGEEQLVFNDKGDAFVLKATTKIRGKFMKDYLPYRKLYQENLDKVKNLTAPGLKLFCYILGNMRKDTDIIDINISRAMSFCEYSSTSQYYSGIMDLLKNDFLVRRSEGRTSFFINVNIFFNGDRTKLKDEY